MNFNNNSVALKCLCSLSLFNFVCWVNTEHRRSAGLRAGLWEDKAKKGVTLPHHLCTGCWEGRHTILCHVARTCPGQRRKEEPRA